MKAPISPLTLVERRKFFARLPVIMRAERLLSKWLSDHVPVTVMSGAG
jgi:hypothetical protein